MRFNYVCIIIDNASFSFLLKCFIYACVLCARVRVCGHIRVRVCVCAMHMFGVCVYAMHMFGACVYAMHMFGACVYAMHMFGVCVCYAHVRVCGPDLRTAGYAARSR